ncbi:MAG TPA: DUF2510 domain-containing protein [Ilumatobacter sp.]|nr:DUF2510 domain-containing protein [Ilumatobacter sp.]
MRLADAPQAGWYPDPQHGARLRWWDGSDWADHWRPPPGAGESERQVSAAEKFGYERTGVPGISAPPGFPAVPTASDASRIVEEARLAARAEAARAAEMFGQQARYAAKNLSPLISEYTSKLARLVKQVVFIAVVLVIAWFVFQAWANMTLFDWIGDRIDNLTDQNSSGATIQAALLSRS